MRIAEGCCSALDVLAHEAIGRHQFGSGIFYADLLVTLSHHNPVHVYSLAQAYFLDKQHRRALNLLKTQDLITIDMRCRYLAACCLAEMEDWEECLTMLGGWEDDEVLEELKSATGNEDTGLIAAMLLLRGKAYSALDNQSRATIWYKAALQSDPFCYDAFKMLIDNHMLSSNEEYKLVESLNFKPEFQWLHTIYRAKCKKYDRQSTMEATLQTLEGVENERNEPQSPSDTNMNDQLTTPPETPSKALGIQLANAGLDSARGVKTRSMAARNGTNETPSQSSEYVRPDSPEEEATSSSGPNLGDNLTVKVCRADWLHFLGAHQECYQLTSAVIQKDPYALEAVPLHLISALELRKKNDLFLHAHRLVKEYPDRPESWFAVGCYYLCTCQFELARRYFYKSTTIGHNFALAWIGFGHAFALQDESDQAMAAYRTAERLFPGLHLPLLGMGLEYHRMSNLPLAEQLLRQAHAICPIDPLVCNELGVLAFRNLKYPEAEKWFNKALDQLPDSIPTGFMLSAWECVLVNLGHVYRKAQQWEAAIDCYTRALGLVPNQASTYSVLAFTHHLQGDLDEAIVYYHKCLAVRPEDSLAEELLTMALKEHCTQGFPDLDIA